jgi:cation:H+ antiporter
MLLTVVYIAGLLFRPHGRVLGMGIDSLLVLALYVVSVVGLFAIAAAAPAPS